MSWGANRPSNNYVEDIGNLQGQPAQRQVASAGRVLNWNDDSGTESKTGLGRFARPIEA